MQPTDLANLEIHYTTCETPFGRCLVASLNNDICNVLFAETGNSAGDIVADLKDRWPKAKILKKNHGTHEEIVKYFSNLQAGCEEINTGLTFYVRGTDFQIKVWEALITIPFGKTSSYAGLAKKIGSPKSYRAVGTAIGNNPIAFIVPCHRILKSDGELGGYRWGSERKKVMLDFEKSA